MRLSAIEQVGPWLADELKNNICFLIFQCLIFPDRQMPVNDYRGSLQKEHSLGHKQKNPFMRTHLLVTATATDYFPKHGEPIVSTAKRKGSIACVNPCCIEVSGFTEGAFFGFLHNMVRYPGIPAEAVADFWRNPKEARPCTAWVKTRCKQGDAHRVRALNAAVEAGRTGAQGSGCFRSNRSRAQGNALPSTAPARRLA